MVLMLWGVKHTSRGSEQLMVHVQLSWRYKSLTLLF